jgi:flagellar hook assembly protein FlgD
VPNPASGSISVFWQVAQAGADAAVKVYDASGRQVKVLFSGKAEAGLNEAVWTGRDSKGRSVPAGVYFCTLETKDDRISRKVILTETD